MGKKRKGTYLTVRRADPSPAREKKVEPGELFRPGSAKGAPRPGRSTAVHAGEGVSDGAMAARPLHHLRSRLLLLLALLRGEDRNAAQRERGKSQMASRVRGPWPEKVFVRPKRSDGRRMRSDGHGRTGQLAAQAGACGRAALLAQA